MGSKYHNIKTTTSDGIRHDSRKEARRWSELLLLERAGIISDLQRQVPFELVPAQHETYERYGKNGQRLKDGTKLIEKAVSYVADFVYHDNEKDCLVVEDAKGVRTDTYIIKRKLMLKVYGIKIREV